MLDGGGGAVEAAVPVVVKAPVSEAKSPARKTATAKTEANLTSNSTQEASKQNGPEVPKDTGKAVNDKILTPEDVQELTSILEQSEDNNKDVPVPEGDKKKVDPEGYEVNYLRAIASKGDMVKNLELEGQAIRQKAESAQTEGEGGLTHEQKMQQLALGYDAEIGGLQIQYSRTKNTKERQIISDKIQTLQKEKIDRTGIKENQIDDLAKFFDLGGSFTKLIEDNINKGTPMLAVTEILKTAVVDKNVRQALFTKIDGSNLPADQKKVFKESLNRKAMVKGTEKGAKIVGIGSLIGMILMMYTGLKKEKQGMG